MEALTVQEAVNKLADKMTWSIALKLSWVLSFRLAGPFTYLVTNFAGFLPYENWRCLENSTRCLIREQKSGVSRDSFCGLEGQTALVEGVDIEWDLDGRNTYAIDWNLLCNREYLGTFISSSYFFGGLIGLAVASLLFDMFGRVYVVKITQVMSLLFNICLIFPTGIEYMLVFRALLGSAFFIANLGYVIISVEFVPCKLRTASNILCGLTWYFAEFLISLCAFLCKDWRYILVIGSGFLCLNMVALFCFLPESPLFLLSNKRDEDAARDSLRKLALLYNRSGQLDNVKLHERKDNEGDSQKIITFRESIKEFYNYPTMTKHLIILIYLWMTTSAVYYGFGFSWAKLGKNLYVTYTLNGACNLSSLVLLWVYYNGKRRRLVIFNFLITSALLGAIAPESIGNEIMTLSEAACLVGSLMNSVIFAAMLLWTQEISPTTHRGKIISICSTSGRVMSLLGPQVSLLFEWNKRATLVGFALMTFVSGILVMLLPETAKMPMPSQASEVISRREQVRTKRQSTE